MDLDQEIDLNSDNGVMPPAEGVGSQFEGSENASPQIHGLADDLMDVAETPANCTQREHVSPINYDAGRTESPNARIGSVDEASLPNCISDLNILNEDGGSGMYDSFHEDEFGYGLSLVYIPNSEGVTDAMEVKFGDMPEGVMPEEPERTDCLSIVPYNGEREEVDLEHVITTVFKILSGVYHGFDNISNAVEVEEVEESEPEIVGVGNNEPVELSDCSAEVVRCTPSVTQKERALALTFSLIPSNDPQDLLPKVNDEHFQMFKKTLEDCPGMCVITEGGYTINSEFLLELAEAETWVSTSHMEILMYFLKSRHSETLEFERSVLVSPWFVNHLKQKRENFDRASQKKRLQWGPRVEAFVKEAGKVWYEDVETVYIPTLLGKIHWVSVVIQLPLKLVQIYDSQPSLFSDTEVNEYLHPLTHMLPYVVWKYCKKDVSLEPLTWRRMDGLYVNERSGDCGPVAVKFMELSLCGDTDRMMEITDNHVDDFRKAYAMDIYKELVLPSYVSSGEE